MLQQFIKYLYKNQVIFALFLISLAWLFIQLRDILVTVFLSYIIMAAVLPVVDYLRKNKVPKVLAVLIPYVIIVFAIILLILPLIPFLVAQIQSLAIGFPVYLNRSANILGLHIDPKEMNKYVNDEANVLRSGAFDFTTKVFGGFISLITVFIVSFYLLMYYDDFKKSVAGLVQPHRREYVLKTMDNINAKLGAWLQGQIVLSLFIAFMSWIALSILNLPFALPLSLLAGILEVVPTLGPTLSAVPAVIVALTVSPTTAVTVAVLYTLLQTVEANIIVPKVMQRAVGLNPVIIILSVIVGANLLGIAGGLLAIPFVSFIVVIFKSLEQVESTS